MTAAQWIREYAAKYEDKCNALAKVSNRLTLREVLAFVLFTPMLRYERSVKCWQHYMGTGLVLKDNLWKTRTRWLNAMPDDGALNDMIVHLTLWESCDVLAQNVAGLGYAKAPFFLSLLFPTHIEVPVCTDTHIMRAVGFGPKGKRGFTRFTLGRAQERMQRRARRAGMPSFAYQWALWDYVRSRGREPIKETYLERDLAVR